LSFWTKKIGSLKIEEDVLPAKSVRGDGIAFERIPEPQNPFDAI
jgi:hypothetical protein